MTRPRLRIGTLMLIIVIIALATVLKIERRKATKTSPVPMMKGPIGNGATYPIGG